MGGIVALKFAVDHPDRMLTGTLVGMGPLQQGGAMQQFWAHRHDQASRSVTDLALTPEQLKAVRLPFKVLIGSNDSGRGMYIESLLAVRRDWPLVESPMPTTAAACSRASSWTSWRTGLIAASSESSRRKRRLRTPERPSP
jgi:hypothetical protein